MLAEFAEPAKQRAHSYRSLYWEAGLIGQLLYLEAGQVGLRGIGCFFGDAVHELLGLQYDGFQDICHFTV